MRRTRVISLLTCGVRREEVLFGQLLFAVEFGDFGTDGISLGVHQTDEGNRSRADATKVEIKSVSHRMRGGEKITYKFPDAALKSSS